MVKLVKESAGCCTELVNKIISSINGEWETIQEYNDLIVQFESLGMNDVVRVIKDINEEEHKHVGQLTEVIRTIAGDSINDIDDIYKGAVEGIEQLSESMLREAKMSNKDIFMKFYEDSYLGNTYKYKDFEGTIQEVEEIMAKYGTEEDPVDVVYDMMSSSDKKKVVDLIKKSSGPFDFADNASSKIESSLSSLLGKFGIDSSELNNPSWRDVVDSILELIASYNGVDLGESLKERYGYGVTISDLNNIRDMIEELIEMMDDVGQSELTPEPNTYRIGHPFIGTREGFIDLTNIEEYISYGEDEESEEYEEESLKESVDSDDVKSLLLKYSNGYSFGDVYKEFAYKDVYNIELVAEDEAATEVTGRLEKDGFELVDSYDGEGLSDSYYVYTKIADNGDKILAAIFMNETDLGEGQLTLQMSINPEDEELGEYFNESLKEDTVKKSNGKWTNRGDDGTEHGEFNTKKEADAQRRAMFANK